MNRHTPKAQQPQQVSGAMAFTVADREALAELMQSALEAARYAGTVQHATWASDETRARAREAALCARDVVQMLIWRIPTSD